MLTLRRSVLVLPLALACSESLPPAAQRLPVAWQRLGDDSPAAALWLGVPGVAGDRALFPTSTGLVALEAATGVTRWEARLWTAKRPTAYNIAVTEERAFVNELDSVYAVAITDGRRLWSVSVGADVNYGHTFAHRDLVLTTTRRPSVVALDAASGTVRWEVPLPDSWTRGGVMSGLGASGDTVYVAASEFFLANGAEKRGAVLALDVVTGRLLWSYHADDRHSSAGRSITVAGALLLVSDLYGNSLFAVDRFTGAERWRVRGAPSGFGPSDAPELAGDTAFSGSNDTFVYAVQASTGAVLWRRGVGGSIEHTALCGAYVLGSALSLAVVPRAPQQPAFRMLSSEESAPGFPTSGFAVVDNVAVFTTSQGTVAVSCGAGASRP